VSSFTRTIQRTLTRRLKSRKGRHYMGRGQRLGVKNPRDAALLARQGVRKTPQKKPIPPRKPKPPGPAASAPPRSTQRDRREEHRARMRDKYRRKARK
jgi:hypothetical protein